MKRGFTSPDGRWRPFSADRHPSHLHLHRAGRGGVVVHHHRGAMRRTDPCHADCPEVGVRGDRSSRLQHVGRPGWHRDRGAESRPRPLPARAGRRTRFAPTQDPAAGIRLRKELRARAAARTRRPRTHHPAAGSRPREQLRAKAEVRIRPALLHDQQAGDALVRSARGPLREPAPVKSTAPWPELALGRSSARRSRPESAPPCSTTSRPGDALVRSARGPLREPAPVKSTAPWPELALGRSSTRRSRPESAPPCSTTSRPRDALVRSARGRLREPAPVEIHGPVAGTRPRAKLHAEPGRRTHRAPLHDRAPGTRPRQDRPRARADRGRDLEPRTRPCPPRPGIRPHPREVRAMSGDRTQLARRGPGNRRTRGDQDRDEAGSPRRLRAAAERPTHALQVTGDRRSRDRPHGHGAGIRPLSSREAGERPMRCHRGNRARRPHRRRTGPRFALARPHVRHGHPDPASGSHPLLHAALVCRPARRGRPLWPPRPRRRAPRRHRRPGRAGAAAGMARARGPLPRRRWSPPAGPPRG